MGSTYKECENSTFLTLDLLTNLGFTINYGKSVLSPCQAIQYLGFIINSVNMTVSLTTDKISKIRKACCLLKQKGTVPIQTVAETVGSLVAACPGVKYGKLFYRLLDIEKNCRLKNI